MSRRAQVRRNRLEGFSWNCFHSALVPFCQLFAVAPFCCWFTCHTSSCFGYCFPHQGNPLYWSFSTAASPQHAVHILLEMFLPAACTSFPGATLAAIEEVSSTHVLRAFQPTQRAAGCTQFPGLWAPLPANTWAGGSHLRTWQRWQHHSEHSKSHSNTSCLL